jgi:phosphatidylserine decarboxylase
MTIHKEGFRTIGISALLLVLINLANFSTLSSNFPIISWILFLATFGVFIFLISFFRIPNRKLTLDNGKVIAPADGQVVVIEEITDNEYFNDKRLQVSIFMSPLNVHVNRAPISGEILYNKYHPGKFLVAWNPKSSTDNERHSIVIKDHKGNHILVKQIAGALARRIVNYMQIGQLINQTNEIGFIKFGSRVDLLLPIETKLLVNIGEKVQGGVTVIAEY